MTTTERAGTGDGLVEMAWDPITRIVGSLGIYTKIDFAQKRVAECFSTSSIFRGYSIFMKGKDPATPTSSPAASAASAGTTTPPARSTTRTWPTRSARRTWADGSSTWASRPSTCSTTTSSRRTWSGSTTASGWSRRPTRGAGAGQQHRGPHAADHGYRTIGDIMRSLNPLEGEFYREALQVSRSTGDVLPDGGPPRPPVDPVPGRGWHGGHRAAVHRLPDPPDALRGVHEAGRAHARRPVRLLLQALPGYEQVGSAASCSAAGAASTTPTLRLPLRDHDRLGPQDVRDPGRGRRRQARHQRPDRDQPGHPHPAGQLLLRGLGRPADVRDPRPGGNPVDRATLEPAHHPQAPEARLRQQLLLGDVAALVRRHRPPGPGHRRRADRPAVVDRPVRPGRHRLHQGHRQQRGHQPAPDGHQARGDLRVEDPPVVERHRAQPGHTCFQAYAAAAACTSPRRRWPRSGPATPRPGRPSRCPTRP